MLAFLDTAYFAFGLATVAGDLRSVLISVVLGLLVTVCFASLAYYLLTLPLRRRERARLFLQVVEAALARGEHMEHAIEFLSGSRERGLARNCASLSYYMFHLGLGTAEALRRVPGLVPPQVAEMLAVGRKDGDIRKVLPACQKVLEDARSRVRGALNYFVLILCAGLLFSPLVYLVIGRHVLPKFRRMFAELGMEGDLPLLFFVVASPGFQWLMAGVAIFLGACVLFYVCGPALLALLHLSALGESVAFLLPWHKKRLQRDFSSMLSVLLDAGVPEKEAVELAARGTANWVFVLRGRLVVGALERGETLPRAIRHIDRSGELKWRLANAVHANTGFLEALSGWHQALDAKADQQQQAAAHVVTSALLLLNGAVVGVICVALFQALTALIWQGTLW